MLVWFAVSLSMCWGCYRECLHIASILLPGGHSRSVFAPIPTWVGCTALAAAILPVLNCLQRGQVGVVLLYFLLLGFRLLVTGARASRSFLGGAVLAIPVVLKATPLLPVAFVLVQQAIATWYSPNRRTELIRSGASVAGTICGLSFLLFFAPAATVGWRTNLHYLDTWWNTVAMHEENALVERFAQDNTTDRNQSLTNASRHFGNWAIGAFHLDAIFHRPDPASDSGNRTFMDAPAVSVVLLVVRGALGCLLLLVGHRMARAEDRLGQTVTFTLAYLLTLVVCQIARCAHYFMIWFPVIVFTCLWLIRKDRPRWAVFYATLPGFLTIGHYVFLHSLGAKGLLGLGTALWFTSVCLTLLTLSSTETDSSAITLSSANVGQDCGSGNEEVKSAA